MGICYRNNEPEPTTPDPDAPDDGGDTPDAE